jgi:hypothetical protein
LHAAVKSEVARDRQFQNLSKAEKKIMKSELPTSRLLLLALLLILGVNALASTTWYVDGVRGNDRNNGKSPATACKTIGHAILHSTSGDSIVVAAATYKENLNVGFDLTIVGANASTTIVDGGHSSTTISVSRTTAHVNLAQLTIRNGSGLSHGGGGIYNLGTLTITNTTVSGNSSDDTVAAVSGLGGGIYNAGTLTIHDTTISGNSIARFRMGAFPYGGGVYNTGRLTIVNSTITANLAWDYWPSGVPNGGGMANVGGTVAISNSTISNNGALIHTPFGTVGTDGGGVSNRGNGGVTFQNSILSYNTFGGNCNGVMKSLGFNVSSDASCRFNGPGEQKNIDPKLGPLQNNGGPTQTMALLAGSPARSAGNPTPPPGGCMDPSTRHRLTSDQRGRPRPNPGACDVGAYNH